MLANEEVLKARLPILVEFKALSPFPVLIKRLEPDCIVFRVGIPKQFIRVRKPFSVPLLLSNNGRLWYILLFTS